MSGSDLGSRPASVACSTCRRAKMKCVITAGKARCSRCERWDAECVFEAHKRGQWRRDRPRARKDDAEKASTPARHNRASSPLNVAYIATPSHDHDVILHQVQSLYSPFVSSPILSGGSEYPASYFQATHDSGQGTSSFRTITANDIQSDAADIAGSDDPIVKRILNLPSAQNLFDCFFKHYNYLVGALDPELFTFQHTRTASPFLFTVVLCISSRVFHPKLFQPLQELAETLLGRTLSECNPSTEDVWATVCIQYWNVVGAKGGQNPIRFAMRMARSASLRDSFASRQAPLNEDDARRKRDRERVWIVVRNLDRSLRYFTNSVQSTLLFDDGTPYSEWPLSDRWSYRVGDSTAFSVNELYNICRPVYEFITRTKAFDLHEDEPSAMLFRNDDEQFQTVMRTFNTKLSAWGDFWGPESANYAQMQPCLTSLVYLYQENARLYFNSIRLHRLLANGIYTRHDPTVTGVIETCYSSIVRLLQETLKLSNSEVLYYLWDTAHSMIVFSTMMLLKIIPLAGPLVQSTLPLTLELLTDLLKGYTNASQSMSPAPDTAPTLVEEESPVSHISNILSAQARLFRHILQRLTFLAKIHHAHGPSESMTEYTSSVKVQHPNDRSVDIPLWENSVIDLDSAMDLDSDIDFLTSQFEDVGLEPWMEETIFIRCP